MERGARRVAAVILVAVLGACAASVSPSPTTTAACSAAWHTYREAFGRNPITSGELGGPMHACASVDDFVAGYMATLASPDPVPTNLIPGFSPDLAGLMRQMAESLCRGGGYSDTAICRGLGITPTIEPYPDNVRNPH